MRLTLLIYRCTQTVVSRAACWTTLAVWLATSRGARWTDRVSRAWLAAMARSAPRRDFAGNRPAAGVAAGRTAPAMETVRSGHKAGRRRSSLGKRLFITGDIGDELIVFALDPDGQLLWRTPNGNSWTGSYPGARASCCYSDGRLYHLNAHGRLACLDAADGQTAVGRRHLRAV